MKAQEHQLVKLKAELGVLKEKLSRCTNVEMCKNSMAQMSSITTQNDNGAIEEIADSSLGFVVVSIGVEVVLLGVLWGGVINILLRMYKYCESLEYKYKLLQTSQHLRQEHVNKLNLTE